MARRLGLLILLCSLFWLNFFVILPPVLASNGLSLSTAFPGIEVRPGETVTFPLELRTTGVSKTVELQVVSAPKGWSSSFKGGGMIINQILVAPQEPAKVDLQVEIPQDVKPGTYNCVVRATGGGSSATLSLQMVIKDAPSGSDKMATQYPVLSGTSTTTFQFRVDLTNNGARERSYSLNAQAPPGWQVTFSPAYDSKQIASLSLKPGESQGLDVTVKPPQGVKAGTYEIPIEAVSSNSKAGVVLKVVITGTYTLEITTPTERLNAEATAGGESPVTLLVKNTGSSDIQNITFTASPPSQWSVTFEPDTIDVLPAGEARQVVAYLKPPKEAIAGDYVVNITAESPAASTTATFRVTVKTSTLWGIVAILLVVGVIGGVAWIFHKYGRR
ncbi:NEW3 domain-containing protein [Thermanaeromonas sp. C210]|uniref:COG1470 family protein n=1 Tax=Thermanaeromonas sp. C210 TaxID=2731925 RepID=UPI00155BE7D2|nr:NEW3 domain-containing protein [Thermanaeromonas sp. C210]GFN22392.1 ABC transporter substrate-binding protein [Thermanaeromonas sp. C210]